MLTDLDFATARRIIFGPGKIEKLRSILKEFHPQNILFVQKKGISIINFFHEVIGDMKIEYFDYEVSGEPDIERIDQITEIARNKRCDLVIGLGGGSVLDTAKAVSAMATNPGKLLDYLEVVGKGNRLANTALPFIAIPTTAGTGSEVTKNAVISVPDQFVKVSMRDNSMLPVVALVDPQLTYDVPRDITSFTGMDAFTQVIEPYLSNSSNSMVDMFCRDAIPRAGKYLLKAFKNGDDKKARDNLSWVSLMGGLSLANAKLGAVHGLAGPMGGMFNKPHGLLCAAVLPAVMQINYELLKKQGDKEDILTRFEEIARWVTGNPDARAEDAIHAIVNLCNQLRIPRLADLSIQQSDFLEIAAKAVNSSSMKGNPIHLSEDDICKILELAH